jgi:hypothetical protein
VGRGLRGYTPIADGALESLELPEPSCMCGQLPEWWRTAAGAVRCTLWCLGFAGAVFDDVELELAACAIAAPARAAVTAKASAAVRRRRGIAPPLRGEVNTTAVRLATRDT